MTNERERERERAEKVGGKKERKKKVKNFLCRSKLGQLIAHTYETQKAAFSRF
jgi:hypothetical protein